MAKNTSINGNYVPGLVSVIIPTYNRADLVCEALNSALLQTYSNLEIIVVDDGSTDNTKQVVNSFTDNRIKYIYQENSGLPAVSRNKGILFSQGEYIAFLDDDDVWFPEKLQVQIDHLRMYPSVAMLSTNAINIPGNEPRLKIKKKFLSVRTIDLIRFNSIINSTVLLKKSTVESVGFLNEDPEIRAAEDWEYWLRVSRNHQIHVHSTILLKYRIHSSNINVNDSWEKMQRHVTRYEKVLSEYRDSFRPVVSCFLNFHHACLASTYYREHYDNNLSYMINLFLSKALLVSKLKIFSWYITDIFSNIKRGITDMLVKGRSN